MHELPTLDDVMTARERIAPYIRKTPLEPSPELSRLTGADVYLKLESMQVTGSFKPRISFNKLLALDPPTRARGAIASTAGGHGIGLSHAGRALGVPVDIFLPATADPRKVQAIERNGARLTRFDSVEQAREAAVEFAVRHELTFVSAYNDREVIAGGGTIGLEIRDELPEVDLVVTGMGGGGMLSGTALALKESGARVQAWGVQPESNPVLAAWLDAGRPIDLPTRPSIAEGLGAHIEHDSVTFPLASRYVDRSLLVSDEEIRRAMRWLLEEHQLVVEPSGAAPVAALLRERPRNARSIVVIVTGRNISRARFEALVAEDRAN